jgi:hypothetical protein
VAKRESATGAPRPFKRGGTAASVPPPPPPPPLACPQHNRETPENQGNPVSQGTEDRGQGAQGPKRKMHRSLVVPTCFLFFGLSDTAGNHALNHTGSRGAQAAWLCRLAASGGSTPPIPETPEPTNSPLLAGLLVNYPRANGSRCHKLLTMFQIFCTNSLQIVNKLSTFCWRIVSWGLLGISWGSPGVS